MKIKYEIRVTKPGISKFMEKVSGNFKEMGGDGDVFCDALFTDGEIETKNSVKDVENARLVLATKLYFDLYKDHPEYSFRIILDNKTYSLEKCTNYAKKLLNGN